MTAALVFAILVSSTMGLGTRVQAAGKDGGALGNCKALQALVAVASHLPDAALVHFGKALGLDLTGRDLLDYLQKLATECSG